MSNDIVIPQFTLATGTMTGVEIIMQHKIAKLETLNKAQALDWACEVFSHYTQGEAE